MTGLEAFYLLSGFGVFGFLVLVGIAGVIWASNNKR